MIESALEMLSFSKKNALLTFHRKYYEYGIEQDPMNRPLTIGGYDSVWDANLVTGYLLYLADDHFELTAFLGCAMTMAMLYLKDTDHPRTFKDGFMISKPE